MAKYTYTLDWITYTFKWENDPKYFQTLAEAIEYLFYQRISYPHLVFRIRAVEV